MIQINAPEIAQREHGQCPLIAIQLERRCGAVFLIVAMLWLLTAFFALFVGLVRFAEHVIQPHRKAALPPDSDWSERTASQDAAP